MKTKLLPLLLLLAVACKSAPPLTVDARARTLTERAAAVEPTVTPVLVEVAKNKGGEMYKLEHRLKTLASTTRKLNKRHVARPDQPIAALNLDDTLRYTMRFEDVPPGHHIDSIRAVLAALLERGHTVVKLKNYWPAGDNYSAVNGVLQHPSGLHWELQFHTGASLAAQGRTRDMYEELRRMDTPVARKRELFDLMTETWDEVPIPLGILEPDALDKTEEIRERPRP